MALPKSMQDVLDKAEASRNTALVSASASAKADEALTAAQVSSQHAKDKASHDANQLVQDRQAVKDEVDRYFQLPTVPLPLEDVVQASAGPSSVSK